MTIRALGPLSLLALAAVPLSGQSDSLPERQSAPPPSAVVVHHAYGQAVAVAIHIPFGSGDDPEGGEGAAWVFGMALDEELDRRLRLSSAQATVTVGRGETLVTMIAAPESFISDLETLLDATLVVTPPDAVLARIEQEHLAHLRFEEGAPVRAFQEERFGALFGADHPWARPLRGLPESVAALDAARIRQWARPRFDWDNATIGIVGPADTAATRQVLRRLAPIVVAHDAEAEWLWRPELVGAASLPIDSAGPTRGAPPAGRSSEVSNLPPPPSYAWDEGRRIKLDHEIMSTWVAVGVPVSNELPRIELELLAYHVRETLNPEPADPGVFAAQVDVLDPPGGPVLMVTLAVAPEAAERWEERVIDILRMELRAPPDDRFFSWERRRFRNALLRAYASPESEATRITHELLRGQGIRAIAAHASSRSRQDLDRASRALGAPRILVYGTDLTDRN